MMLQNNMTYEDRKGGACHHSPMNYEDRKGGARHHSRKTNAQVNVQVPGTDLVNGAVFRNSRPAAATSTSKRTQVRAETSVRLQGMVNGYFNQEWRGFGGKAVQPRTSMRQRDTNSAVTDGPASGRAISAGIPGGVSMNGNAVSLPCDSDQMKPELSLKAEAKNCRRWKKVKNKRRGTKVNCPKIPTALPVVPQEEEDWEKEIKEVTVTDWEKMNFGIHPYGPEDLLDFDLRDLTLKQLDPVPPPVTAGYRPAIHHPRPLQRSCYSVPTEPDQFADADD